MKEKDLTKKIVDYLNSLPQTFAFRVENRPGMAHGCSDIIGCRAGKFMAVEVKLPGNKPTQLQERFLRKVREAGGIAIIAYSLEQLDEEWF